MEEKYYELLEKQHKLTKIIAGMVAGIFLVVAVGAVVLVPKAANLLNEAQEILEDTSEAVGELNQIAADLEEADLPGLIRNTQGLISQSSEGVSQSLQKIETLDIDTMNQAIADLASIVEPLAKLFGRR